MGRIFLSYAREDRAFAVRLARFLGDAGHQVWWDRQIESGDEFSAEIEAALDRADVVLVAWSVHSAKSPWVRDEAGVGRDSGRMLPVTLDGSQPPMGFRQLQTLDLTGWKASKRDDRNRRLLSGIERRLKATKQRAFPRAQASRKPLIRGWRFWAAGVVTILIAAAAITGLLFRAARARAEPASLAVLPFKNLGAGNPYFADGVAEDIADQLSREPQFKVAGRTSSDLFKDAADLQDVGRRLHVAYVLEGSVRSDGRKVRVEVALVETSQGMRLWEQEFDGTLNDIFAIQDRVGEQTAAHLKRQLLREPRVAGPTMPRADVYSIYITARSLLKSREPAKIAAATELLKESVKLDPNYAPAWAQLALATDLGKYYGHEHDLERDQSHQEEFGYARRAVLLAPKLAEAHAIYGLILGSDTVDADKLRESRQQLEIAVRLNPNDALAWYWLSGERLNALDFEEAETAMRHTAELDPFFPPSIQYGGQAWELGDRAEAVRFINNRIENYPDSYGRYLGRIMLATLQNDVPAAYRAAKVEYVSASPDQKSSIRDDLGSDLLQLGFFQQAERIIPEDIANYQQRLALPTNGVATRQSARDFWLNPDSHIAGSWVKGPNSAYLVGLYDGSFSSPRDMASRFPRADFVDFAPLLAIALHRAGRRDEAIRLLTIADSMCAAAKTLGRTPRWFRVRCSRVAALMGRKEEAVHALEQAFAQGWRPNEGEPVSFADDPAYGPIRDDPRLLRMDALMLRELASQRRQLLTAGL